MSLVPTEVVIKRYENDIYGFNGCLSLESGFMQRQPLPSRLPPPWSLWDEYMAEVPNWYRHGQICERLIAMPSLDSAELPDEYLIRANMILGMFALGFQFCWNDMHEQNRKINVPAKKLIVENGKVLSPIQQQVILPWQKLWAKMGRHRSCVEADLFSSNYLHKSNEMYDPAHITGENAEMIFRFFHTRTEHRFWFVVIELHSMFPAISAIIRLQHAMRDHNHGLVAEILLELTEIWTGLVEEVLSGADIRVSAIEWGNTTARWSASLFEGEEGFSGMFVPAWHVMDQLVSRNSYESFLGTIMLNTRKMLPRAWQEYIAAVGEMSLSQYVEKHGKESVQLSHAYRLFVDAYHYFFRSHRRKVFAFEYQSMFSGRAKTNAGITASTGCPGWDLVNNHLLDSEFERPSCPSKTEPILVTQISPYLIQLPIQREGWLPGDKAYIDIEREDGSRKSLTVNLAPALTNNYLPLWSTQFQKIKKVYNLRRIPGEFCRPPKKPMPVIIFADETCAGLAATIANSELSLQPILWMEAEKEIKQEIQNLFLKHCQIEFIKNIPEKIIQQSKELFHLINKKEAHVYIFGAPSFANRVISAFREAINLQTLCVNDIFRIMREEMRLHLSVLASKKDYIKSPGVTIYPWDIAVSTNPNKNMRVVLHNKVLNLTNFVTIHRGGENIMHMMAGSDISNEFEKAHPHGELLLGVPGIFIEAEHAKLPDYLQPWVHFLYSIVRYVNAFVVTQTDVMANNKDDVYVCANTLLHALQEWPTSKIWGEEFQQVLGLSNNQGKELADYCNNIHQKIINTVIHFMSTDEEMSEFKLLYTEFTNAYESFGRSMIEIISELLKYLYTKKLTELSEEKKEYLINEIKILIDTFLVDSLLSQIKHVTVE